MIRHPWRFAVPLFIACSASPAAAANPFSAVSAIVMWFQSLNAHWGEFVSGEERRQLIRQVDGLRQGLASLYQESDTLLGLVPDHSPSLAQRRRLLGQFAKVESVLVRVKSQSLLLSSAITVPGLKLPENSFSRAIHARAIAVRSISDELQDSLTDPARWKPNELRRRLNDGLASISSARAASTEFRDHLAQRR